MARVKYDPLVNPLNNEHYGYTFQNNHYGHSMQPASRSARFRRPRQHNRQHNNQRAVTQWRNMSPETKAAWNLFASTYVQSTKRGAGTYLTGYQLFIKRNSYCFLNHGITSEFMTAPEMESLEAGTTIFELTTGDNTIDLTELYISNFGILPVEGQSLLFCAIPYSDVSGQFFTPIFEVLTVLDIFIDGFFLNLSIPPQSNNILYSIYLSKPVSAGQSYAGTKTRYMGCFTTKKFTALTDVPAVTPADEGKVWSVNPDGTWGVNESGGGGGLTCEDLPACPEIININSLISSIGSMVSTFHNTSIPAIKNGLLYNGYCFNGVENISSNANWLIWDFDIYYYFQQFLVKSLAGGKCKETGLTYWQTPNTGADNSTAFNARGAGQRLSTGLFSYITQRNYIWITKTSSPTQTYDLYIAYNSAAFVYYAFRSRVFGNSIRLCKPSTTLSEGEKGTYVGNNGRIYRTVVINAVEYMADNLAETLWRDGSAIQEVTDNAAWAALTTPALCAYNNDWSNV